MGALERSMFFNNNLNVGESVEEFTLLIKVFDKVKVVLPHIIQPSPFLSLDKIPYQGLKLFGISSITMEFLLFKFSTLYPFKVSVSLSSNNFSLSSSVSLF